MGTRVVALIVAAITIGLLVIYVLSWTDQPAVNSRALNASLSDAQRAALAPDWIDVKRLWIRSAGVGGALIIIGIALGLAGSAAREPLLVRHNKGIFPGTLAIKVHQPVGNDLAHVVYAGVSGRQRLPGATLKHLSAPPKELPLLEAPAIDVALTPYEILKPNLATNPHLMIVGKSGAGKTNVGKAALGVYRAELPDAEFMICSLIASNWQGMVTANTPETILETLRAADAELTRRDQFLVQHGITDGATTDELSAFILLMDEAETTAQAFGSGAAGREFRMLLRRYASMSRNAKMAGIWLTQTADRDLFPKAVIENSTVLLGKCSPNVAAQFALWDSTVTVQLPGLEIGRFYAMHQRAWVQFPKVNTPHVRLSELYRAPLLLTEDGEADGLGENDQPDGPLNLIADATEPRYTGTRYTTVHAPVGGGERGYTGIVYRVPSRNDAGEDVLTDYDENLHRRVWDAFQTTHSIKRVQSIVKMGYEGGTGWYLAREIRRLGQQGKLPWMEG